jgi:gas vesicle protein
MSKRDAYKQKIEAELELAMAKLAEMKAHAKSSVADVRIQSARISDDLENRINATKARLGELGEASEEAWERLKEGVEHSWKDLSSAVKDASAKFSH